MIIENKDEIKKRSEQMVKLFEKGVDGLITDCPDKGVKVLRSVVNQ